jgi:hypothetical protein
MLQNRCGDCDSHEPKHPADRRLHQS